MTKRQQQKHDWYLKNKERLKRVHKKYYELNKEEILKKGKKYTAKHKEKTALYQKKYRIKHKNKLNKQHNEARKRRLKNDINFRIRYNLRVRLFKALHRNQKTKTTIDLLGCSIDFFKGWIENQFQAGMTWDNYGKWEIDHIIPCASFDMSKEEEQTKCFHYTNLQPLWELDNIRKKDMI